MADSFAKEEIFLISSDSSALASLLGTSDAQGGDDDSGQRDAASLLSQPGVFHCQVFLNSARKPLDLCITDASIPGPGLLRVLFRHFGKKRERKEEEISCPDQEKNFADCHELRAVDTDGDLLDDCPRQFTLLPPNLHIFRDPFGYHEHRTVT